jgi:uncharacterized protein with PIN domain
MVGMGRILKAYQTRFYQLLRQIGARRPGQGVDWLVNRARQMSAQHAIPLSNALSAVLEGLTTRPRFQIPVRKQKRTPAEISFFCDAGLGGLARWLRAAGYQAWWESGIPDDQLLARARQKGATILTTDSMLMERRLLRDRIIPSLWLPPTLKIQDQLERVFHEFQLRVSSPRCMRCGGELSNADKESLRERIPPRTLCWLDEYYLCTRCGHLFWHGTHWQKIAQRLKVLETKETPS